MTRPDAAVSLADLAAAGVRLRPLEVVTIVRELATQVAVGEAPGMPSAHVIRLSPSGAISIEGPVAASGRPVARAAQLLDSLLPGFDAAPEFRAPGGLRLVIARALGTLDLPAYTTLEAFSDALARFSAPEAAPIVRQLVASWSESVAAEQSPTEPAVADSVEVEAPVATDDARTERVLESFALAAGSSALTISDVRRARRATGLTLSQISERSRIPVALIRELEWGYLPNWPTGYYGRTQLVRYARAAGLDEEVVVRTVWPLVEERVAAEQAAFAVADPPPHALVVDDDLYLAMPETFEAPAVQRIQPSRAARFLAALAIPALLAIAIAPAAWYQSTRRSRVEQTTSPVAAKDVRTDPAVSEPPPLPRAAATTEVETENRTADRAKGVSASLAPPVLEPAPATEPRTVSSVDETSATATSGESAFTPTSSAVGSAAFYAGTPEGGDASARAENDARGAVLRITRIVDDTAQNFHVRPSPDGSRIAFDSDREGERAVYVADADGKHVRRVTGDGFAAIPSWSPDGESLAFVRAEDARPDVWNLWTTDLKAGSYRRLTKYAVGRPWGASWFPDGKRIAYSYEDRLIVLDTERGIERVYTSPRKGRPVRTPSVSPDGNRLVFQVSRDGAWLLELKDGSMRKILDDPSAEEYTWAPDGSRVAYHSARTNTWGIWVMAPR